LLFFNRGYLELRSKIAEYYGQLNPGNCWVSESCFLPRDAHKILFKELQNAAKKGKGKFNWFPNTVIKDLEISPVNSGEQIKSAIAIQHQPKPNTQPLNTATLSQTIEDSYNYDNSPLFQKKILKFVPQISTSKNVADWYVIDATETGEIIALADVPYRLGVDPRSYLEPSSSTTTGDPYCTQGFTYTFAMQKTAKPETHEMPSFYPQYQPYYSYELPRLANFNLVFTYRQILGQNKGEDQKFGGINFKNPTVGDISMQNWTWGNDYRPGNAEDNLIYTREQLTANGQLLPGGWLGGLRTETLRKGEENAFGYFYWLVAGNTDSQLGDGVKKPEPNHRFLAGLDSPMGTKHGLSKYPYIREARRIIGLTSFCYPYGFLISEIDIASRNYTKDFYQQNLTPETYLSLKRALGGTEIINSIVNNVEADQIKQRIRAKIYPDSVGIGHYAIDFHPCMELSPPELPGNKEREGERQGGGQAYPFQIPLRALIPQKIDNLLVAGKNIATSHVASAAYRVHSFEWSSGVAAGMTAIFALEREILPYQLVDDLPNNELELQLLRRRLDANNNPTTFPKTSIFNESWNNWR
jgi:hypothetical protein